MPYLFPETSRTTERGAIGFRFPGRRAPRPVRSSGNRQIHFSHSFWSVRKTQRQTKFGENHRGGDSLVCYWEACSIAEREKAEGNGLRTTTTPWKPVCCQNEV